MFYSEEEKLPKNKLEDLMLERLKALVTRVYDKVPFYRKKFDEVGVKPGHIQTLKDISKLSKSIEQIKIMSENKEKGLFILEKEFKDNFPDVCPLCNQKMK